MNKGKWFLMYSCHFMVFGCPTDPFYEEIPLDATTEDDAVTEAKMKWKEMVAKDREENLRQGKVISNLLAVCRVKLPLQE